ncbi:unnamed protein product, partial [Choristocarpus tenellus]
LLHWGQEVILGRGGRLVGEQIFTDVYWDGPDCSLTKRGWWLRSRGGRWELKLRPSLAQPLPPSLKTCL